jgi:hypothetical protein
LVRPTPTKVYKKKFDVHSLYRSMGDFVIRDTFSKEGVGEGFKALTN